MDIGSNPSAGSVPESGSGYVTDPGAYLAGQLLFNAIMLFVPAMLLLVVLKQLFGVDIGFSFAHYGLLLGL